MKREERQRVLSNRECINILSKDIDKITEEEKVKLRELYTGYGSMCADGLAQFYTPGSVCKMIANYVNPLLPNNPKVLEPSAGTGGLIRYIRDDAKITCVEIDQTSSKIMSLCYPNFEVINDSAMNHDRDNYYDIIISNPPFNIPVYGDIDKWECAKFDKKKNQYKANSDALFLELAVKSLKVGGYGVFILPSGVGYKAAMKKTRQMLLDSCWIIANIELPPATFSKSGTTIKTHIIIFRKAPKLPKFKCTSKCDDHCGEFLLGQPPIQCVQINDIGFDEKGRESGRYKDNDWYSNQLEEALERISDDLYRQNTCPEKPTWSEKEDITQCMYWGEYSNGYQLNKNRQDPKDLVYFQELTLGRGCEIEYNGVEYSTLDWDVMDKLVNTYGNIN